REPRALVAVLRAPAVQPAAVGVGVGDGLGVLVAADDREAVEVTVVVDEVHAAGRSGVGLVRHVGVGEVAARAVVGAPLGAEAALRVAGRREDHIVGVWLHAVEVAGEASSLGRDLALGGACRNRAGVDPGVAGELVGGVGGMRAAGAALDGAGGDARAVLLGRVCPHAAPDAVEESLHVVLGVSAGVTVGAEPSRPLGTPVDDVDRGVLLDRAAVVEEVRGAVRLVAVGGLHLHERGAGLVRVRGATGGQDDGYDGQQRQA